MFNNSYADDFMSSAFAKRQPNSLSPVYHQSHWPAANQKYSREMHFVNTANDSPAFSPFVVSPTRNEPTSPLCTPRNIALFGDPDSPPQTIIINRNNASQTTRVVQQPVFDMNQQQQFYHQQQQMHMQQQQQQIHFQQQQQQQFQFNNQQYYSQHNAPQQTYQDPQMPSTPKKSYKTDHESDGDVIMKSPLRTPQIFKQNANVNRNPYSPRIRSNAVSFTLGPEYANEAEKLTAESKMAERRRQVEENLAKRRANLLKTKRNSGPETPDMVTDTITVPATVSSFARPPVTRVALTTTRPLFTSSNNSNANKENAPRNTHKITPCKLVSPRKTPKKNSIAFTFDMANSNSFHLRSASKLQQARANRCLKGAVNQPHQCNTSKHLDSARSRQTSRLFERDDFI